MMKQIDVDGKVISGNKLVVEQEYKRFTDAKRGKVRFQQSCSPVIVKTSNGYVWHYTIYIYYDKV